MKSATEVLNSLSQGKIREAVVPSDDTMKVPTPITSSEMPASPLANSDIINAVKEMTPAGNSFNIIDIKDIFLEGKLYSVGFTGSDGKAYFSRVYKVGNNIEVFKTDEMLLSVLGQRYQKRTYSLLNPDLIAGYIAILIMICIGYLVIVRGSEIRIPDILANALTIILGYYFGRSTSKSN
jgi:hypothetical protein